jgi:WD40 repeat protein
MITQIIIILPQDYYDDEKLLEKLDMSNPHQAYDFKKHLKYVTAGRDGKVKVWGCRNLVKAEITIKVSDSWVMAIEYMTLSRRLVAATANRMISFYDLSATNPGIPTSRIENMESVPLCMEYFRWPDSTNETKDEKDKKYETLIVCTDLGFVRMYDFKKRDWHMCEYRMGIKDCNNCHKTQIMASF